MATSSRTSSPAASVTAGTQTLHRAAVLLRLITSHNATGMRLVDLFRRASLERPTAHRILQGLIAEGMVRQDGKSKRYHLGNLIYEMGLAATPRLPLREICMPYLRALADQTGDTCFMTVRSGFDGVCVGRADGDFPIKFFVLDVGRRRPLNVGASGMALLAAMPDDEVDRLIRLNAERTLRRNPRFSEAALRTTLATARRKGYVVNKVMDAPPVMSVGVAVRYPDGTPAAGISISTLSSRLGRDRLASVVRHAGDAVEAMERDLASHWRAGD